MKISILTYGTRGDVQPFVALAVGLQKAGHIVRIAAPARFADFVSQYNISFAPLPGDPEELSKLVNNANGTFNLIKVVASYIFSIANEVLSAAFAASGDADLIVHSYLFTTGAHSFARAKNIPDVSVQLLPLFAPTRSFPSTAMPNLPPGTRSYLSHWLIVQIFWHLGNLGYARLRHLHPETFRMALDWPFDVKKTNPTPLLLAYSPTILPRPDDWTASYIHVSGYLFLDTPALYQPPEKLAEFLKAGESPVCITFGSMVTQEANHIDQILRTALKQTKQRGLILSGWGGASSSQNNDNNLFYIDAAPHDWLFPRCKTIVHHGGAGTTAAGLRAGIPNIIVPHAGDQSFWGKRVTKIGAGTCSVNAKNLSTEALINAFIQVDKQEVRERAQIVGLKIEAENGVREAVYLIEKQFQTFKRFGSTKSA